MRKRSLDGDHILTIDAFLTAEECASFVARSEAGGYEDAPITLQPAEQQIPFERIGSRPSA